MAGPRQGTVVAAQGAHAQGKSIGMDGILPCPLCPLCPLCQPEQCSVPRGVMDSRDLARLLVTHVWLDFRVDPVALLCLVIPREELERGTDFGAGLYKCVLDIIGRGNCAKIGKIIPYIQEIISGLQSRRVLPTPLSVRLGAKCGQGGRCVIDAFRKKELVEEMWREHEAHGKGVHLPVMAQMFTKKGTRCFRMYRYMQDMVVDVGNILLGGKDDLVQVVEAPMGRAGVIRLYVDAEMYLSRMACIHGESRQERIECLRGHADCIPALLSRIYASLMVIKQTEMVEFVIKENSRESSGGDYKVSLHIVSNLLVTCEQFDMIQSRVMDRVTRECPRLRDKMYDIKSVITDADEQEMGVWMPMCFCDMASTKHKQMLRCAYSRKSLGDTQWLVPKKWVTLCDGKVVAEGFPQGFCPSGIQDSRPHLTPVEGRGALWDTMICIPGPRCKGVPLMAGANQDGTPKKRKRTSESTKERRITAGSDWSGLPSWLTTWATAVCRSESNLPTIYTNVKCGFGPGGLYHDKEKSFFQVLASPSCRGDQNRGHCGCLLQGEGRASVCVRASLRSYGCLCDHPFGTRVCADMRPLDACQSRSVGVHLFCRQTVRVRARVSVRARKSRFLCVRGCVYR